MGVEGRERVGEGEGKGCGRERVGREVEVSERQGGRDRGGKIGSGRGGERGWEGEEEKERDYTNFISYHIYITKAVLFSRKKGSGTQQIQNNYRGIFYANISINLYH